MDLAVVTGVSKGLGEQIAKQLLKEGVFVLGVSRSVNESLQNQEQYEHIAVDLVEDGGVNTVMEAVEAISKKAEWNQLYVVNNAAMLEPVGFAHTLETEQIKSHYMLNVFVPMALTAACIRLANELGISLVAGNITSGAANSAIPGWSVYSSGKAAIDMYTASVAAEQEVLQANHKLFAFSPGVMDTDMQASIRQENEADFPNVGTFRQYKESGRLVAPDRVASIFNDILRGRKGEIQSGHVYHVSEYM